jgi:hypothetical protein
MAKPKEKEEPSMLKSLLPSFKLFGLKDSKKKNAKKENFQVEKPSAVQLQMAEESPFDDPLLELSEPVFSPEQLEKYEKFITEKVFSTFNLKTIILTVDIKLCTMNSLLDRLTFNSDFIWFQVEIQVE